MAQSEKDFYHGKLQAAHYYIEWELSQTTQQAELLKSNNTVCFDMRDEWFGEMDA